jgi:UDP-glucose 6-dehydrogenase
LIEEGAEGRGVAEFAVVSNPEFLREGSAVYDTLFPDRIVVGADSREPLDVMRVLYEPIIGQTFPTELDPRPKTAVPFVRTDLASAEMIKYAANAFLAAKISLINEISALCELTGDELRSAPSLQIAGTLLSLGSTVIGYEPVSAKAASTLLPDGARAVFDPYEALEGAHAAVLVTEWEDVKGLDPKKAASLMRDPKLVVDGRNVLDPTYWREAGLQYTGFGRE